MKMYRLLGADGKEYLSETPGTFGGNGKLKIYGRLDCPSALSTIKRFPGSYEKSRVFLPMKKLPLPQDTVPVEIVCVRIIKNTKKTLKSIVRNLAYNVLGATSVCSFFIYAFRRILNRF